MSNYSVKIAAFTCNTSGTRQNITPSGGPGTNPKAALFYVSGATSLDSSTAHARYSAGMTDGTTQRACGAIWEDGNANTSTDNGWRADSTMVISMPLTTSEALDGEASFVAWTNDGVAIDWADFPATALRGYVVFFYGSNLSATVATHTPSTTQDGTSAQTGIGFKPDAIIAHGVWNAFSDGGNGTAGRLTCGAATNYGGSIQQGCRTVIQTDQSFSIGSIHRDDSISSRMVAGTNQARYEVTSFDSDGFTTTTRDASNGGPFAVLCLNLNGGRAKIVTSVQDTNATGQKFLETIGFKPTAALFFGGEATAVDTFSTAQNGAAFFGAANSTESAAWGVNSQNGGDATLGDTYSVVTSSGPIGMPTVSGGIQPAATLTGFTANGINYNVVAASTSDFVMSFLAFEETDARIGSDTEQISDQGILLVTINRRVSTDTERIADEFLFRSTDRKSFSDTENVTDAFRLVVTSDFRSLSDTEQVADAFLLVRTSDRITSADTERLTDAFNMVVGNFRSTTDTVNIGDGFVLVSSGAASIITTETERISDAFVTVLAAAGNLTFVATETERISDTAILITGRVMVSGDTVALTDAFNSGQGLIARKAIKRGRVF